MFREQVKLDPGDFGGFQIAPMSMEERAQRYCCAAGCAFPGFSQMTLRGIQGSAPEQPREYRLLCKRHVVLYVLMVSAVLGDPSPSAEAREVADIIGLDWIELNGPVTVFDPDRSRCVRCGGGMVAERVGMYSGTRYVHTCGEPKSKGKSG
jgi:hypothetical protein